jgi:dTDP-4-dehydrorhamnose 3,5-epimerase
MMQSIETALPGVIILKPQRFGDARGFFSETFRASRLLELGLGYPFVQDNWSRSSRRVLRGLHLQNPHAQAKIVSVVSGEIYDVAVDVRIGSPTFARHVGVRLSEENGHQLLIPRGFAHGFQVLSDRVDLVYKCDDYYSPPDEITLRWDDPALTITWPLDAPILSNRDATAPLLSELTNLPRYTG